MRLMKRLVLFLLLIITLPGIAWAERLPKPPLPPASLSTPNTNWTLPPAPDAQWIGAAKKATPASSPYEPDESVRKKIAAYFPEGVGASVDYLERIDRDINGDGKAEGIILLASEYKWVGLVLLNSAGNLIQKIDADYDSFPNQLDVYDPPGDQLPLVSFVYDRAGSADFQSSFFYQWDGSKLRLVLNSAIAGVPKFRDLNGDGSPEIMFHVSSKSGGMPVIFTWCEDEKRYAFANCMFAEFFQEEIDAHLKKLKEYKSGGVPLALGSYLYILYENRGGQEGVDDFIRLMEVKLAPTIANARNDYLQNRAIVLMERIKTGLKKNDCWTQEWISLVEKIGRKVDRGCGSKFLMGTHFPQFPN